MHHSKAGSVSARRYDAVKGGFAAYVRYLDLLAVRDGGSDASVGRVPTLAEWCGGVQRPRGVVLGGSACRPLVGDSLGEKEIPASGLGDRSGSGSGGAGEKLVQPDVDAVPHCGGEVGGGSGVGRSGVGESPSLVGSGRGPNWERNRMSREKKKANRKAARASCDSGVDCKSGGSSTGSVHTVDTRTGVEIEASQTLAARRVAENKLAVEKAEAERILTQHRIAALKDKDRTKAVARLAAARMEEKINKSKRNSEEAYKSCEESLKSLGSTGSAGEFALKQQIKDARETELLLKYTKAQADLFAIYATPDVLAKVAALPPPVIQDEFEAFGDCPDYYTEGEREQYYADLNRRNAEKAEYCDTGDAW